VYSLFFVVQKYPDFEKCSGTFFRMSSPLCNENSHPFGNIIYFLGRGLDGEREGFRRRKGGFRRRNVLGYEEERGVRFLRTKVLLEVLRDALGKGGAYIVPIVW
jgi:hypothetical protein